LGHDQGEAIGAYLWIDKWKDNHLLQSIHVLLQTANILKGGRPDIGSSRATHDKQHCNGHGQTSAVVLSKPVYLHGLDVSKAGPNALTVLELNLVST
jgi:hypothetical protein